MTEKQPDQTLDQGIDGLCRPERLPTSTYRLQLTPQFGFAQARAALEYIAALGVSEIYTSPYLQAREGSTHGYDVIDHNRINEELGGESAYEAFTDEIRRLGMGHVLDMVPNHMAIATNENTWWQDVLQNGESSIHADYFDIDWHPLKPGVQGRVLLPILGDMYGNVLERGELQLERQGGAFFIRYYEKLLPVAPKSVIPILEKTVETLAINSPEDDQYLDGQELQSIITALRNLPSRDERDPSRIEERNREKEVIRRRLDTLFEQSATIRSAVDRVVAEYNGRPGDPHSFDLLDCLLGEQSYRLSFWKVATEEINYRRFFDVNDLAALRMEDPRVFQATHAHILNLIAAGRITGLRLDHTDGLYAPRAYFQRLQLERCRQLHGGDDPAFMKRMQERLEEEQVPRIPRPLYLLVEKILEPGEHLPTRWAIHGTTGYDFLNAVGGLWVDRKAERSLSATYRRFTGVTESYEDIVYRSKKQIMRGSLASEIAVLAHALKRLAENNRRSQDYTLTSLTAVIIETIACFPVYRTYLEENGRREEHDDEYIEQAIEAAKLRNPGINTSIFNYLRDMLLLRFPDNVEDVQRQEQIRFALKFQQVTSPVMAKGVEDTTFYVYNRLVSLNEVGGDPGIFGTSPAEFHAGNLERLRIWPLSMTSTATHDTKRGEDMRARISVLSEMPADWRGLVTHWNRINRNAKREVQGQPVPSNNDEYLFYQTLLGAWPMEGFDGNSPDYESFVERIDAYMLKAVREAKRRTGWITPNEAYEQALQQFVQKVLKNPRGRFVQSMQTVVRRLASYGACNSLSQLLLKMVTPGVPDCYQGSELWDLNLVDPDNRRPADFERRRQLLQEIQAGLTDRRALARNLLERFEDGAIKLYVISTVLNFRREHPDLFLFGDYQPIRTGEHVLALERIHGSERIIAVVPRFALKLTEGEAAWPLGEVWGNTVLNTPVAGRYENLLTGEQLDSSDSHGLPMAEIFAHFPLALLRHQTV
ncbi:malto-oligosyltrehalose synthase [Thermithiobacillus plumbiphilus]|uniref:Malto-oligosyltrehalose synthase n=1 Tax=Thermithiobacillus plumbiphilus TaxID=1729899 RepID=A0ABU9DCR2_9PROT